MEMLSHNLTAMNGLQRWVNGFHGNPKYTGCMWVRRPYGGSLSGRKVLNSRYLIISGSISFGAIQECLAEFFNPTHCEGKKLAGF
jgi:hypothetical protein